MLICEKLVRDKLTGSKSPGSGTFVLNLAKVYLSKLPLPVPLPLALFFSLCIFLGGHAPRKINNEQNKANGNGNFDRYTFARFSKNVPTPGVPTP